MFSGLILRQTDTTKCFQGALTLWASEHSNVSNPVYGYCKASNVKHVFPDKKPLFVVSSDKGEQSQDSLLLSLLTFATIIPLKN